MSNKLKRWLLAGLAALLPLPAFAAGTFFWNCESTTLDSGSYSAGDTTAIANGGISISSVLPLEGSNSCLTTGASDYYIFDPTSIMVVGEGGFAAKFRWTTTAPTGAIFSKPLGVRDSADNDSAGFASNTTPRAQLYLRVQGSAAVTLTHATTTIAADTTYYITGAYDIAGDRRYIRIYNSSCSLLESVVDTTTDLSATQPGNFNQIRVGNSTSGTNVLRVDHVILTSDYDDDLASACSWTQYKPTYTAGPTDGTFTDTTLPFNYTVDHTGVNYLAVCPNGQTIATGANVESGTCSGGAAVATANDANVQTVADAITATGLTPGTTYDVFMVQKDALGWYSDVQTLADKATTGGASPPAFAAGPTITPISQGFRFGGTADANADFYAVCYPPALGLPSEAQIKAGTDVNDDPAWLADSEAWVDSVADTLDVTAANKPFRMDCAALLSNGDGDSAISSWSNQDRDPPSGWAQTIIASIDALGYCDQDAFFTPDCAVGHGVEYQTETHESADCLVTIDTDGIIHFDLEETVPGTPDDPLACTGRLTFDLNYEATDQASGLYSAPAVGNFVTADVAVTGNLGPTCSLVNEPVVLYAKVGEVAPDVNLKDVGDCEDPEGDLLTATLTVTPSGLALSGTGNQVLGGTPDTENESGISSTARLTDIYGAYDEFALTYYPVDTWAMTNCVGLPTADCLNAIILDAPWRVNDINLTVTALTCAAGTPGLILTQDPVSASENDPDVSFSVTVSRTCAGSGACVRPKPLPSPLPQPLPPPLPGCDINGR